VERGTWNVKESLGEVAVTYEQWEATVPKEFTRDSLWKMESYRLGLFLADLAWHDALKLTKNRLTLGVADQLFRAASSVSPNLSEGYSRGTGKDRARFYEYALGSVRECRDWYYKARHVLDEAVIQHRLDLCIQLTRLLLKTIPRERAVNQRVRANR
jgi:four helix bundle protein